MKAQAPKQGLRLKSECSNIGSQGSVRRSSTKYLPTSAKLLSSLRTSELLTRTSCTPTANDNTCHHDDDSHLIQEVKDLRRGLTTALARIDDGKHSHRRQSKQLSNLYNENISLKSDLERACRQIVDLQDNAAHAKPKSDDSTSTSFDDRASPTENHSEHSVQGLLRRFIASKASSISSTMCSNVESTSSLASPSTSRRRRSSLMESLAEEELPPPPARRVSSMCLSLADEELPNNKVQRRVYHYSLYSLSKPEGEEWLDERCILNNASVQNTYTARRA